MIYIDAEFYNDTFKGRAIPSEDFDRLAEAASEAIYAVCRVKPDEEMILNEDFKKAVCYETELLYEQGGLDAIMGLSVSAAAGGSESLGDYSVSAGGNSSGASGSSVVIVDGIPVSSMSIMLLRRMGLMSRCAYAGVYRAQQKNPS